MIITAHGGFTLKITSGETTIVLNPPQKGAGVKPVRFGADIALVSQRLPEMEGIEEVQGKNGVFVIDTPGAYERHGVIVEGWGVRSRYGVPKGKETAPATLYKVALEDSYLFSAIGLSEPTLPAECLEALERVDVLFVPVGAPGMLSATDAHKLVTLLEPRVVVPVGWQGVSGGKEALERFLKESGAQEARRLDKLTLKPKDLREAEGEIVVLEG